MMNLQRKILRRVIKGDGYDDIAMELNITEREAHAIAKDGIRKWTDDLAHTAMEAREVDLKRMDRLLAALDQDVFPEPAYDAENPDLMLYAARNRLFLSEDGGRFWRALVVELPEIEAVSFV